MRRTLALAALALLPLAACGDDDDTGSGGADDGSGSGAAADVVVVAESISGFDQEAYEATAGEITFEFRNADSIPHNMVIEDQDFKLADDGETGTVTLDGGEYVIFCDIPGHRQAGMESTLTVS